MYRILPPFGNDPRNVAEVVNGIMNGKTNNTGSITLATGGATTTTLLDSRIGIDSKIILVATNEVSAHEGISYATFANINSQTATALTRTPILWSNNPTSKGIIANTTLPSSGIKFINSGVYQISYNLIFSNPSANSETITVWLVKNGVDGPQSASSETIQSKHGLINGTKVSSRTLISSFAANDVLDIYWSNESVVFLEALPVGTTPVHPSGGSAVISIHQVDNGYTNAYVSSVGKATATITHPANSTSDKTYNYVVIG